MLKKITLIVMMASVALFGSPANSKIAQIEEPIIVEKTRDFYAGIGLNANETWGRDANENFTTYGSEEYTNLGLSLVLGYDAIRFDRADTYIEFRVGQSYWMEDSEDFTTSFVSILVKPTYNINNRFGLYGLLGYTYVDWQDNSSDLSHSTGGLSIGLGAIVEVKENWYVSADYLLTATDTYSEYLQDNVNFSQVMVSLLYKF